MTGIDAPPPTTRRTRVRDFLYHLTTFLFVILLLVIIDVRAGAGDGAVLGLDWAYWVILTWGFGVAAHGVYAAYGDDE